MSQSQSPKSTLSSKLIILLSSILLSHSCYSAHEHTSLQSSTSTTSQGLPLDIILETILSVSLFSVGIVLSSWEFKPIQWRIWAGQLERKTGHGPYEFLESRPGFLDIRAKRVEFAEWQQDQERVGSK